MRTEWWKDESVTGVIGNCWFLDSIAQIRVQLTKRASNLDVVGGPKLQDRGAAASLHVGDYIPKVGCKLLWARNGHPVHVLPFASVPMSVFLFAFQNAPSTILSPNHQA